ncbi:MAG TPA: hypothetical protein ENH91_13795 [Leeuwenhoekiella sp.]|nr:hypothetical protein [Leeuwenhoekiella sp.]
MHKIIALCLTTIFAFNLLGHIVLFKVQQYQARREAIHNIKSGLPDAQLTRIFIKKENLSSLLWLGDDEFRYRGKMYDVIKKRQDYKGNTIYYCYDDSLESFLYSRLTKHVKNSKKNQKNRNTGAKITFKYLSRKNTYSIVKVHAVVSEHSQPFFNYTFFYNSPTLEISGPPPKLV